MGLSLQKNLDRIARNQRADLLAITEQAFSQRGTGLSIYPCFIVVYQRREVATGRKPIRVERGDRYVWSVESPGAGQDIERCGLEMPESMRYHDAHATHHC
jgi:hypothetical protein